MKKSFPEKLYNLIPSQQSMYLMVKFSFSKQLVQIPISINVDLDIDFDVLTKALNIEFERNDALRLRYTKVDKQLKQYFLPSFKMSKVPMKYFRSVEQRNEYLDKDAQKPVRFDKGECYRILFYKTANAGSGIYFNVTHISMDALGAVIFFLDLMAVYRALMAGTELPEPLYSYEEYIAEELKKVSEKKKWDKHEKFYREYFEKGGEPFYAGVHGPNFLEKARIKTKNPDMRVPAAYNPIYDKCKMFNGHIGTEDAAKIFDFCKKNSIAPESLFMMGLRTHCSAINYRIDDVFFMATCSKRATVKEKRMSGCLAQPIQVRTILPETATFMEGLKQYTSVRTQVYRHTDYPYILAKDFLREIYGYKLIQGPACMMFTWIPLPINMDLGFKFEFKFHDLGRYFTPLYTICSPDPADNGINLNYMYRVKLSCRRQIEYLHRNTMKVIMAGIENPDITVKELLDMCN